MKKTTFSKWLKTTTMVALTTAFIMQPVWNTGRVVFAKDLGVLTAPVTKSIASDFVIEDGVLVGYNGEADELFIPEGVTKIAKDALTQKEYAAIHLPVGLQEIDHDGIQIKTQGKVYLPSGWEGDCVIYDYMTDRQTSSIASYMQDEYGCSLVIPTDVKNVTEYSHVFTKVIVDVQPGDENSYKNTEWYAFISEKLPVFETTDFDADGYVIRDGVLLAYDGPGGDLVIPDTVTEIADAVFEGMDIFDSITIPDSVKKIGEFSFANLRKKCKSVTIGKGLTEIPAGAFRASTAIERMVIKSNVESVGEAAFWGLDYAEISIPEGIKRVDTNAFAFCNYLPADTLKSVEIFGDDIFVAYPYPEFDVLDVSNAKTLGSGAFASAKADVVVLGEELEVIPDSAFYTKAAIKDVVWPTSGNLKYLEESAFKMEANLLDDNPLPNSIETIENYAIVSPAGKECNVFYVPEALKKAEKQCVALAKNATIVLPNGWLGDCEFENDAIGMTKEKDSYDLTLVIPENVSNVEDYLIYNESIKNYVIKVFPNSSNRYFDSEWYQKLIDSGVVPSIQIDESGSVRMERVNGTNEYELVYSLEYELEQNTSLQVTIPEGFSYVPDSYNNDMISNVKENGNAITATVKAGKSGAISLRMKQEKLLDKQESVEVSVQLEGSSLINIGLCPIYANFGVESIANRLYVNIVSGAKEAFEVVLNDKHESVQMDGFGKCYPIYRMNEDTEIYLSVYGMESEKILVEFENAEEIMIDKLVLEHKQYGAKTATLTDITTSGKIVTCYPKNTFIFTLDATGIDDYKDQLFLKCGDTKLKFVKVGDCLVAQGQVAKPDQKVEIYVGNNPVFATNVTWIIDPSGYLYEVFEDNRVEGATVSIYYSPYKNGVNAVKWDAENYGQKNDLVTGLNGYFAWDVPQGYYRIVAKKDGYETVKSAWLPVPPPQLDVNLEMKDLRNPSIKGVTMTADHMMIYFDKYMDSYSLDYEDVICISSEKTVVEVESCSLVNPTEQGYSKVVRVDFKEKVTGDALKETYTMKVNDDYNLYSYASVRVDKKDKIVEGITIGTEITDIEVDQGAAVTLGKMIEIEAKLLATDGKIENKILATSTDESVAKIVSVSEPDKNGIVKVRLASEKLGETAICIEVEGTNIEATIPVVCVVNNEVKQEVNRMLEVKNPPEEFDAKKDEDSKKDEDTKKEDTKPDTKKEQTTTTEQKTVTGVTTQHNTDTPKKGSSYTVKNSKYKILTDSTDGTGSVSYVGTTKKNSTSITVGKTVVINGYTYKITQISNNAFKRCSKLKTVTIGANITKIGKNAFKGCKKLKKITVKTTKLKSVGKNAFKGVHAKCKIKVPKKKLKAYKKLMKNKGQGKSVTITK